MERVIFECAGWSTAQQDALRASIERLGLCGCGSDSTWDIVLLLLERAAAREAAMPKDPLAVFSPESEYAKLPTFYDSCEDASERWVEFGAKVLDSAGLLEHGTGIGSAWLTDSGKEMLRFLREFGSNDDEKWPEWATAEVYR